MGENRAFKKAGIKLLMEKNYQVPSDALDLEAMIDDSLSMAENWYNVKDKVVALCDKDNKIMYGYYG